MWCPVLLYLEEMGVDFLIRFGDSRLNHSWIIWEPLMQNLMQKYQDIIWNTVSDLWAVDERRFLVTRDSRSVVWLVDMMTSSLLSSQWSSRVNDPVSNWEIWFNCKRRKNRQNKSNDDAQATVTYSRRCCFHCHIGMTLGLFVHWYKAHLAPDLCLINFWWSALYTYVKNLNRPTTYTSRRVLRASLFLCVLFIFFTAYCIQMILSLGY